MSVLSVLGAGVAMMGCSTGTEETRVGVALLVPSAVVDATVVAVDGTVESGLIESVPSPEDMSLRLTSADGLYSARWETLSDYRADEPLRAGNYKVEMYHGSELDEGFDCPFFYGTATAELADGSTTAVSVDCRLANAMVRVEYSDVALEFFESINAVLHSDGGAYINYPAGENRPAFMRLGHMIVYIKALMSDGTDLCFVAADVSELLAGHLYSAFVDVNPGEVPEVVVSFDDRVSTDDFVTRLTPDFISASEPVLNPVGFIAGESIVISEGSTVDTPLAVNVESAVASSLLLTTQASSLTSHGWPAEIDLAVMSDADYLIMKDLGLEVTRRDGHVTGVVFTDVLENLRTSETGMSTFTLLAESPVGKVSAPLELAVNVNPVDLSVLELSDVLIGSNVAHMKVLAPGADLQANMRIEALGADGLWIESEILDIQTLGAGESNVTFSVPETSYSAMKVRVSYCGEVKARVELKVVSPAYRLVVDPFATRAVVRVEAEDANMREMITSKVNIYVNGHRTMLVSREPAENYLIVGGLTGNTEYTISSTLFDVFSADDNLTKQVTFVTERTMGVPNGSFEDIKRNAIKYNDMPSGGRYSQNIVDIFNQQNYHTFDLHVPKQWANTNDKTFNKASSNHNTWYMQPSVYTTDDSFEGAFAVALQSTAFDPAGEAIQPYRQTSMPFVKYSRNIPSISFRAAGKIFLGEYGYNAVIGEEIFEEGVPFGSRPSSLNGYYKFMPSIADMSDRGYVYMEVLGDVNGAEVVIARGRAELGPASGYTAFNVPLTYNEFGIKATRLKLLLSSTVNIGSVVEETVSIATYPNPETSTSLGGLLIVDGLTFSY